MKEAENQALECDQLKQQNNDLKASNDAIQNKLNLRIKQCNELETQNDMLLKKVQRLEEEQLEFCAAIESSKVKVNLNIILATMMTNILEYKI